MNDSKIKVLLVEPEKYPKEIVIDDSLEAMQEVVGGDIEEYMPYDDDVAIICNEEGKMRGLPLNRAVYVQDNDKKEMVDIICGKFFICYAPPESESFQSLPDDMIKKYENYKYMYETFVRQQIGSKRVSAFLKSDVKRFYNYLVDERGLKPATVDGVHNILHQIFDMAVDDNYIRNNPTNNVLRELKKAHCFKTEKRRGLTRPEQELFMDYLKNSNTAVYWYPVFAVMLGTGLRVGEVTGLRWCDIDLEDGIIDVNHTLVYYDHRTSEGKKGCYFNVNTPKTEAGNRQVPMLDFVKEAFVMEKERQELLGVHCEATIDGYTDFIFLNRFGQPQHQSTLNKAIRRIIRDCNDEQFLKTENPEVLLPHFSCHSLRHTFTTRMCEAGVNIKVIQDTLGHKDITTTLNIYTDVTKELKKTEFEGLDKYFDNSIA